MAAATQTAPLHPPEQLYRIPPRRLRRAYRLHEQLVDRIDDAIEDRGFLELRTALENYLKIPTAIRQELDRWIYPTLEPS